jgi:hypothetical protein
MARGRADSRGGKWNDGGTLALDHLVLRSNSARGGLFKERSVTLTDVIVCGNTAHVGSGMFSTRNAAHAWRGPSMPTSTGRTEFLVCSVRRNNQKLGLL